MQCNLLKPVFSKHRRQRKIKQKFGFSMVRIYDSSYLGKHLCLTNYVYMKKSRNSRQFIAGGAAIWFVVCLHLFPFATNGAHRLLPLLVLLLNDLLVDLVVRQRWRDCRSWFTHYTVSLGLNLQRPLALKFFTGLTFGDAIPPLDLWDGLGLGDLLGLEVKGLRFSEAFPRRNTGRGEPIGDLGEVVAIELSPVTSMTL